MLGLVVLAVVAVLVVWGRQWIDNRQSAPSPTWKPAPTSTVAGTPRFDVARAQLAALPVKGWDPPSGLRAVSVWPSLER